MDWLGHHAWHHARLARATQTARLLIDDLRDYPDVHAGLHQAVAHALGVAPPPDFLSYDLTDRAAFEAFMLVHALDHQRLDASIGDS